MHQPEFLYCPACSEVVLAAVPPCASDDVGSDTAECERECTMCGAPLLVPVQVTHARSSRRGSSRTAA